MSFLNKNVEEVGKNSSQIQTIQYDWYTRKN